MPVNWIEVINELGWRNAGAGVGLGVLAFVLASGFVDQVTADARERAAEIAVVRERLGEIEASAAAAQAVAATLEKRVARLESTHDSVGAWGAAAMKPRQAP